MRTCGSRTPRHALPVLATLLRARLLLIAAVAAVAHAGSLTTLDGGGTDWTFFTWAAQALIDQPQDFSLGRSHFPGDAPGGLSLYANYPFIQIGPPSIVLAAILRLSPSDGLYLTGALILACGILVIALLDRAFDDGSARCRTTLLIGGAATAVTWVSLARFVHLDDALTLAAAVTACIALLRGNWLAVGVLTGFAAASKPWGVVAVALVLAAPSWRTRAKAGLIAATMVLAFWGPFMVADVGTLALGDVQMRVAPDSVPALLGIDSLTSNGPLRLAQLTGGLLIAAVLTLRGRWQLALAAAFAWRLLLDPSPYAYYLTGLATAGLLVDLSAFRRPVPVLSLGVVSTWFAVSASDDTEIQGMLNMAAFGGVLLACCILLLRPVRSPTWNGINAERARDPDVGCRRVSRSISGSRAAKARPEQPKAAVNSPSRGLGHGDR